MAVRNRCEHRLDFAAQNAFVRPGETGVGQIRRAAGKNLLVRRLHVRVRAHHGADLAVEHPRERNFFRGRLGVKIHEDDRRVLAQPFRLVERERERIVQRRLHEGAALRVHHGDGRQVADFQNRAAFAGRAGRIIQRTQKARLVLQQFHDFLLIPQMVAGGDGVHAVGEKFRGDVGRDAVAAGGVLAVGDDDVEAVRIAADWAKVL